jgi:(2Fe-2S) ferredoxin
MKTNAKLLEHGVIVCQWRASGSQGDCGAHAYVLVCPDRVYLTEVTPAEMRTMLEGQYDVDQVLAYLSNPSEA